MLRRLILALALLLLPAPVLAEGLEGSWALRIDGTTIFRFDLEQAQDGEWQGRWTRPESFASNGEVFMRLAGTMELASMAGLAIGEAVELSFDDPRPDAIPDIFRFRLIGDGQAELAYVGTPLRPYPLVRVARRTPLGPFEDARVYDRDNVQTVPEPIVEEPELAPEPTTIDADFLNGL